MAVVSYSWDAGRRMCWGRRDQHSLVTQWKGLKANQLSVVKVFASDHLLIEFLSHFPTSPFGMSPPSQRLFCIEEEAVEKE